MIDTSMLPCDMCDQVQFNFQVHVCEKCGKIICSNCLKENYPSIMISPEFCPFCYEENFELDI